MRPIAALAITCLGATLPGLAASQVNPEFAAEAPAIEEARQILQQERRLLVQSSMVLTDEESAAFWPIYDRYAAELKKAGELRVRAVTDFAANFETLSDKQAREVLDNMLRYQEKVLGIRKQYRSKFRKALPEQKVVRLYQIEHRIDTVFDYALAREIPLAISP
jgi:hypothetical protein